MTTAQLRVDLAQSSSEESSSDDDDDHSAHVSPSDFQFRDPKAWDRRFESQASSAVKMKDEWYVGGECPALLEYLGRRVVPVSLASFSNHHPAGRASAIQSSIQKATGTKMTATLLNGVWVLCRARLRCCRLAAAIPTSASSSTTPAASVQTTQLPAFVMTTSQLLVKVVPSHSDSGRLRQPT